MAYDYQLLEVEISGRIATVTINNPPINIIPRLCTKSWWASGRT